MKPPSEAEQALQVAIGTKRLFWGQNNHFWAYLSKLASLNYFTVYSDPSPYT
jgi:hypothetical protein